MAARDERERLQETLKRNESVSSSARQTARELRKAGKTSEQLANRARRGLGRMGRLSGRSGTGA